MINNYNDIAKEDSFKCLFKLNTTLKKKKF